jgi:hypothetical protein
VLRLRPPSRRMVFGAAARASRAVDLCFRGPLASCARRDACLAGSVSPPSWPALVRASPLALPGAEEAEASLVRHAPSGPTGSFNPCLPRRLLPKVQAGPDDDPKIEIRGASS